MKAIHRSGLIVAGLIVGAALGALAASLTISFFNGDGLALTEVMENVKPVDTDSVFQSTPDEGAHACADDELSDLRTRQGEFVLLRLVFPKTTGRPSRC